MESPQKFTIAGPFYRWTDYEMTRDGCMHPARGSDREVYDPSGDVVRLPTELARVVLADRTDEQLPALSGFYREFGLLGHYEAGGSDPKRRSRVIKFDGKPYLMATESWIWALDHARNVALCQRLSLHLQRAEYDALRALFEAMGPQFQKMFPGLPLTVPTLDPHQHTTLPIPRFKGRASKAEITEAAHRLLQTAVGANASGVERRYDAELRRSIFYFDALLPLIYWQVLNTISGERLRQCPCGAIFQAQDDRQRFCPAPSGVKESRCGRRFRMRELRAGSALGKTR